MIELDEQQRQELARSGWPPQITNPATGETFVMISKEMFDRVRPILEDEDEIAAIEEMYPLLDEALGDDSSKESA